jgi:DNA mismatch endonuclease (patch repair protein)
MREERSRIMSRIRSQKNRSTELLFIQLLKRYQITGWRRGSTLPGKPDFVFRKDCIVVFVDGDFWHGNPRVFRIPKSNVEYWTAKIEGNIRRDLENNRKLKKLDWRVLHFWESTLTNKKAVAARLRRVLG